MAAEVTNRDLKVDWIGLAQRVWSQRKRWAVTLGIGLGVGVVVAFSLPAYYEVELTVSPEADKNPLGQLGGMASVLGLGDMGTKEGDAIAAPLYPEVMASHPFLKQWGDMEITNGKERKRIGDWVTEQAVPWWDYVLGAPGKLLSWVKGDEDAEPEDSGEPVPKANKREEREIHLLQQCITAEYDRKKNVLTADVCMQDPVVACIAADSLLTLLKNYVTEYKTRKARMDYDYTAKLVEERRAEYYDKQRAYAVYADQNQSMVGNARSIQEQRLRHETELAFQVYSEVSNQLEVARAKLQQAYPVFTVLEPPRIPIQKAGPRRMVCIVGFGLVGLFGHLVWILFGPGIMGLLQLILKNTHRE
ncbi:MAG: hypothetical protein SPF72_08190 [Parabacteroides sp.]|nr:hypothetical protein [Parabacteroides sp.]MDY5638529.1 hypothetical protein [Parabacteroides sp.]